LTQARKQGLDVELTVAGEDAGDGSYRAYLERLIDDNDLSDRVRLAGALAEGLVRVRVGQNLDDLA